MDTGTDLIDEVDEGKAAAPPGVPVQDYLHLVQRTEPAHRKCKITMVGTTILQIDKSILIDPRF
jgi:hypothetical protein